MTVPRKSILDRSFRYVDSASTDVRATFARARQEQQMAKWPLSPVVPIQQRKENKNA